MLLYCVLMTIITYNQYFSHRVYSICLLYLDMALHIMEMSLLEHSYVECQSIMKHNYI